MLDKYKFRSTCQLMTKEQRIRCGNDSLICMYDYTYIKWNITQPKKEEDFAICMVSLMYIINLPHPPTPSPSTTLKTHRYREYRLVVSKHK